MAAAQLDDLQIQARQSRIGIVEPKSVNVGPGSVLVTLNPPTRGTPITLPGGDPTDGLTTFLEGRVRIERAPGRIRFLHRGTSAILGSSGEWFPGVIDPAMAVLADLAVSFDDGTQAFRGEAALRGGAVSFRSAWLPLTETPPASGMFTFPADVQFLLAAGFIDFNTNLPMVSGRTLLVNVPQMNAATPGTLTVLVDGRLQISLPVEVSILHDIAREPTSQIELTLQGRIVAASVAMERSIPVPAASPIGLALLVLVLATIAGVGFVRRKRG